MTTPQRAIFDTPPALQMRGLAERPLREWPIGERPVERLSTCGPPPVSDAELLAVLFTGSGSGTNPVALAQQIIVTFGGWRGLQQATLEELQRVPGLGRTRAAQVKAALEVARRTLSAPPDQRLQIRSPVDVAPLLIAEMSHLDQEELRVVCLDTRNRIQRIVTVYKGTVNRLNLRIGEVFKEAVRLNSTSIIIVHNHPSGQPDPSDQDVLGTRRIVDAGRLFGIEVLDHLVIGQGRFVSMRQRGLGFAN